MKSIKLTLVLLVLTLMSCEPKDPIKVAIENEIGEISVQSDGVSVPVDYEVVSYNLVKTTTYGMQNFKASLEVRREFQYSERRLEQLLQGIEAGDNLLYADLPLGRSSVKFWGDSLQNFKRVQDDIVALDYEVVIEYYHPTIKINVTQEKEVTLKPL